MRDEVASSSLESAGSSHCWDSGGGVGGPGGLATVPEGTDVPEITTDGHSLPFQLEDLEHSELLSLSRLNKWDYPIFDLASDSPHTVLSQVCINHKGIMFHN